MLPTDLKDSRLLGNRVEYYLEGHKIVYGKSQKSSYLQSLGAEHCCWVRKDGNIDFEMGHLNILCPDPEGFGCSPSKLQAAGILPDLAKHLKTCDLLSPSLRFIPLIPVAREWCKNACHSHRT